MNKSLTTSSKMKLSYKLMVIFVGIYLAATPLDYVRNLGLTSHITKIIMLGIIIFYIINNINENYHNRIYLMPKNEIKKTCRIIMILYIYMFLTVFESQIEFEKTKLMLSIFIQCFGYMFIILNIQINRNDIKKVENIWFILIGIFSLLITAFNLSNSDRSALIFFKGLIDPNFYTAILITPFLIGIKTLSNKNGLKKIFTVILIVNMIFTSVLSGSRGSTIAIIVSSFIYFYNYYKKRHELLKMLKTFLIFLFVIFLVLPFIPQETLKRFSIENMLDNGGAGRTSIWKNAIQYFNNSDISNKILGNGIGTFRYTAGEQVLFEKTGSISKNVFSHNMFFTILIEGGVIGLIIFFLLLENILITTYRIENKVPFCSIIGLIIASMFIDSIYLRIFWAIISYALIYIKSYELGEKDE